MRRGNGGVIKVAAVAALALGTVAPVAAAAASAHSATPGWRLVKTFGQCNATLHAITAAGPRAAWATGHWGCPRTRPLIARSDGRSWQVLQPPQQFADSSAGDAVAALSRSYAWTFVSDASDLHGFALLWQNGHWRSFRMPGGGGVGKAVAFSRSDAWAFGSIGSSTATAPYAARFNGRAWRRVPMPVLPMDVTAPGPRNIWAIGQLAPATKQPATPPLALAHWTGRWRTILFPKLSLPPGGAIDAAWVVPDKSVGVWILADVSSNPRPTFDFLLHWTGSRWTHLKFPYTWGGIGPLAQDGHGGLWIATYPLPFGVCCNELAMVHYSSAGVWTRMFLPFANTHITSMRLIPGTRSVWAGGAASEGTLPTIFKYGP
jgi:hypothetical protein